MSSMKHLLPEFEQLKKRYPAGFESSLTLPCLRRIQQERGYVADEDIDWLVEYLGVSRIQIEEVLSFYTQYRRQPIGRWHLQTCHNVSCSMRGAERLIDHLARRLGIQPGETTPDGRFTLSHVECLRLVRYRAGRDGERRLPREHERREGRRAAGATEMTGRKLLMTFPVTPTSHRLDEVRARGGYETLKKVLASMTPEAGDQGGHGVGDTGTRRRSVPGGSQVVGRAPERRPTTLPVRQRRRRRARHVQGPLDTRERAAPAGRVDGDRGLRTAGAQWLRLYPRRVRPAVPAAAGGGRRSLRRRATRREDPRHRLRL